MLWMSDECWALLLVTALQCVIHVRCIPVGGDVKHCTIHHIPMEFSLVHSAVYEWRWRYAAAVVWSNCWLLVDLSELDDYLQTILGEAQRDLSRLKSDVGVFSRSTLATRVFTINKYITTTSTTTSRFRGAPSRLPFPLWGNRPTLSLLIVTKVMYCGDVIASYKQVTYSDSSIIISLSLSLFKDDTKS